MSDDLQSRVSYRTPRTNPWRDAAWLGSAGVLRAVRTLSAVALAGSLLWAMLGTVHWPLVGDAPLMHYVVFLLDHGKAPYREIVDINMPGTYALQWMAIHWLGPGALGWRMFDFALVLACLGSMLAMAWPVDWLAGLYAGAVFALIHFRDGPYNTGQRDLMMTTALLAGCALLFEAERRHWPWLALGFGLAMGAAATIKPTGALFAAAFAAMLWWRLRSQKIAAARYLLLSAAGFAIPVAACVAYLVHEDALRAFWEMNRGLMAYHAALGRPSMLALVVGSLPALLRPEMLLALPLAIAAKVWRQWMGGVLLVGFGLGAVSYIVQGKGFVYHRYPEEAFLALLCALLLVRGLSEASWMRWPALLGVAAGALVLAPQSAWMAVHFDSGPPEFEQMLTADLTAQGGAALDGHVQCLDMTAGCLNTLYRMKLVQATGYLYDCYLFQPQAAEQQEAYRAGFWNAMEAARPRVLVVTDQQCFSLARNWDQVARWPEFERLLAEDYTMVAERTPPHRMRWWRVPQTPYSYQLYVRKDGR